MEGPYKLSISGQARVIIRERESLIIRAVLWAPGSLDVSMGKIEIGALMSQSQE